MSLYKYSYHFLKLPKQSVFTSSQKKYFFWFCAFCLFIAFLELGQDFISSIINDNPFRLAESLSYKLFWPLFIPFSIALDYTITKIKRFFGGFSYYALAVILVLFITFIHLLLFSFSLYGISNIIHEDPSTLLYLLNEKLSTRLYIALSIYAGLSVLYIVLHQRKSKQQAEQNLNQKTITIKNGKTSVILDVTDIKWISSDGPYLEIHTNGKKHLMLESLKDIIKRLPKNFKRIHRSTIVNIDMIAELESRGNGDYDVIMKDDQTLRLSRNYTKPLKGILLH